MCAPCWDHILCRYWEPIGVVDPIIKEKQSIDFVPLGQNTPCKMVGGGSSLGGVGGCINDYGEFHVMDIAIKEKPRVDGAYLLTPIGQIQFSKLNPAMWSFYSLPVRAASKCSKCTNILKILRYKEMVAII